jgi:hypothetical protein
MPSIALTLTVWGRERGDIAIKKKKRRNRK